jgi:hypothetical protein
MSGISHPISSRTQDSAPRLVSVLLAAALCIVLFAAFRPSHAAEINSPLVTIDHG